MTDATVITTALATTGPDRAEIAAIAFLSRYSGSSRRLYTRSLREYFQWCADQQLDPLEVTRLHVELYIRHLQDERHNKPATIGNKMAPVRGMYKYAVIDGLIDKDPAAYARVPKIWPAEHTDYLDRMELGRFLVTAHAMDPMRWALAVLLGMLGMRVSEACNVQVGDFDDYEQGYRVLRFVAKGSKPRTVPLPVPVHRALDAARGDRPTGPLLLRRDGHQLDRGTAYRWVDQIARRAGVERHVHPHLIRHSWVTNAFIAGVELDRIQHGAGHADPRTTMRYNHAHQSLDRHAVHSVVPFIGAA